MQFAHLRGLDVGMLMALQALIEERSITRAAERVFLSQPAMSRTFDRLQKLFGDELLVRTRQGYEPTHRALHLYAELERLLPRLDGLVRGHDFDPKTATDTFRIAATDYAASVIFPSLIDQITKLAPHLTVEILPWDNTVFRRLETNALDLALWMNAAPKEFRSEVLFEEQFMCLVRTGHPIGKKRLTLKRYLSYPHAIVTLAGASQGYVDWHLEEHGLARTVALKLPYFTSAAWIIEKSDMILTVPKQLATRLVDISETRMLKPPIELTPFRYIQVWHPRLDTDPAHLWLRRLFARVSQASAA